MTIFEHYIYHCMTPSFVAFVVIASTMGVLIGIFIDLYKKIISLEVSYSF